MLEVNRTDSQMIARVLRKLEKDRDPENSPA